MADLSGERWLTTAQAAAELRVSRVTVLSYGKKRQLERHRRGRGFVFGCEAVLALRDAARERGARHNVLVTAFEGFPVAALDFYDDLEVDNTKSFWEAHKSVYAESVQAPMKALCAALEPEFGSAKIFRPYRDVRFAADKTPYKTNQGAFVGVAEATGWYVDISARGVRVGGGFYHAPTARLAAFRAAAAHERFGPELEGVLDALRKSGYDVGGEQLKTAPRGFDKDHPRIELLRHKSVTVGRMLGFEPVIHTPELVEEVREHWRALSPLVEWSRTHLAT